ncbi:hypothetical protein [Empedobacter falsenii]|uniref:DUF4595 domain-containing protein n=1 Tax=Empedobacter falsenii TaxID=343874 RepID=A0AAW7DKG7_9FLAO|nr:hypothetical protein [Empedobacter falsenii]MDM1547257.1 hypothetical protein [Empedobacter falsenii]MDM1551130.1 hypothetical protein [Empedobacter falsenii]
MKKIIYSLGVTTISLIFIACNNDDDSTNSSDKKKSKLLKEIISSYNNSPNNIYKELYTYTIIDSLVNKVEYYKNDTLLYTKEYNYLDKNNIIETNYSINNFTKKIESTITHQLKDNFVKSTYEYANFDSIIKENSYEYMIVSIPIEITSYFDQCGVNRIINKDYNFREPSNPYITDFSYKSINNNCNRTTVYRNNKKIGESVYVGKNVVPTPLDHFKIHRKDMLQSVSYIDPKESDFNYNVNIVFDKEGLPKSSTEYSPKIQNSTKNNNYSYY